MRVDRRRLPTLVMKISACGVGRRIAPGICALRRLPACRRRRDAIALRWAASSRPSARMRTLPRGSHKPATKAAAESFRTSLGIPTAYRDPSRRTRTWHPEMRMLEALLPLPFPIFWAPVAANSRIRRLERISDTRHWSRERRRSRNSEPKLRADSNSLSQPKRSRALRDCPSVAMPAGIVTWRWRGAGVGSATLRRLRNLSLDRQIVKEIRQRLGVHQAMFDRHVQQGSVGERPGAADAEPAGLVQRL